MRALISIHPAHVEKIIAGTKKFEYRRKLPSKKVSSLLIYATVPVRKVVAEVEVVCTIKNIPEYLWNATKNASGITKEFFDEYFQNVKVANAFCLGKVNVFDVPKELSEFGVKAPPQSFVYIE